MLRRSVNFLCSAPQSVASSSSSSPGEQIFASGFKMHPTLAERVLQAASNSPYKSPVWFTQANLRRFADNKNSKKPIALKPGAMPLHVVCPPASHMKVSSLALYNAEQTTASDFFPLDLREAKPLPLPAADDDDEAAAPPVQKSRINNNSSNTHSSFKIFGESAPPQFYGESASSPQCRPISSQLWPTLASVAQQQGWALNERGNFWYSRSDLRDAGLVPDGVPVVVRIFNPSKSSAAFVQLWNALQTKTPSGDSDAPGQEQEEGNFSRVIDEIAAERGVEVADLLDDDGCLAAADDVTEEAALLFDGAEKK